MGKKKKVMYSVMSFRYGLTNGFSTLITTMASTYWAIFLTDAAGILQRSRPNLRKRAFWRAVLSAGLCLTRF